MKHQSKGRDVGPMIKQRDGVTYHELLEPVLQDADGTVVCDLKARGMRAIIGFFEHDISVVVPIPADLWEQAIDEAHPHVLHAIERMRRAKVA